MTFPRTLDVFCRVVDNYGDIGVCWRLARQLVEEHGIAVRLWVDDLASFRRICFAVDPGRPVQQVQGVEVRHWTDALARHAPDTIADVVIEAFACELPSAYVEAMARRAIPPAWINLEYLSAEDWVGSCHRMPSRHPRLPLTKHFFFPGFSPATGGLLAARALHDEREAFQRDGAARDRFLVPLRVRPHPTARLLSLFCYPSAPVHALLASMAAGEERIHCLVPEGVAADAVSAFLGTPATAGAQAVRGALTVQVLPFLEQGDYDRLLWSCEVNFVRGEDSFVRAQWAARPVVWQIYAQDEDAHLAKLDAFLRRYLGGLDSDSAAALAGLCRAWNGDAAMEGAWAAFAAAQPALAAHARDWARTLRANGDLASNLVQFVREIS